MDLLIFADSISPRIEYVFNHIFVDQLGLKYKITTQINAFNASDKPKLSYSKKKITNGIFLQAHKILFETKIVKQDINISVYKNQPIFFTSTNIESILPFDPFAAIFYMLSRYEEYLDNKLDRFGRFPASESLAFKNQFLQIPVVDKWIIFIKDFLLLEYPHLKFKEHNFSYLNTIDIDNAFAYLEKGFFRTVGSFMWSIIKLNFNEFFCRLNVLLGYKRDPYDTYDKLLSIHNKYNLKTIIFFLLANYGRLDRNVSYKSKKYQSLINYFKQFFEIGIHASYASLSNPKNLHLEIERLNSISGLCITKNRQHYLVLNLPSNYENLIKNNILEDYSMGFPDDIGFRAGTSHSFNFFNLKENTATDLLLRPFCAMDITLKNYLELTPHEAVSKIKLLIDEVKKVHGCFISIWHNESFKNSPQLDEWFITYENMIRYSLHEKN